MLAAAPGPACDALATALEMRSFDPDPAWLAEWLAADAVVPRELERMEDPFEPKLLASLEQLLPADALLWLSSSMPVRDVEACFPQSSKPLRFLSNRGANGIDGVVSSAAGAVLATGRPTFLVTGELALLHDVGGLLAARRAGAELTIVCINNSGGGIFDFLPVAEHADPAAYEEHVATPAGVDLERLAALAEIPYTRDDLGAGITHPGLVELRTDRGQNVARHRELSERVCVSVLGTRAPGSLTS
jgi:2-succinyl-5-enolpyruvyl-6-hydroxy-3-cyclohexene-1-carboxylate synthase